MKESSWKKCSCNNQPAIIVEYTNETSEIDYYYYYYNNFALTLKKELLRGLPKDSATFAPNVKRNISKKSERKLIKEQK